jgi:Coenzyme PQQ synthesis protein D (PqqD)
MTKLRLFQKDLDWREVEGEVIALKRESAAYLGVNRSGTLLWHALQAGADEAALAGLLVRHYGITCEAARLDVRAFLEQLRAQGLVQSA